MRLVKFKNGKYGLRTFWFFGWHFRDLANIKFNWTRSDRYFEDCQGSIELCKSVMDSTDGLGKYTIVKDAPND